MTKKVAILIDCMPSYRKNFYERLVAHYGEHLHVYCQEAMPGHNMKLVHEDFPDNVKLVKYFSVKEDQLVVQRLSYVRLLSDYDVFVVYGNPRFPATLLFAYLAKLFRKKVVIWAQYHTANANNFTENIRHKLISFFDSFFLYNDSEVELLREWKPNAKCVVGMNNGLDQDVIEAVKSDFDDARIAAFKQDNGLDGRLVVLSCARLLAKNNFDFFIRCLPKIKEIYPNILWCVIGDGPEKSRLDALAGELSVADVICWQGAIYDEAQLAPWYLCSHLFVHPSGAGLSLNHALGYGVPVITHNDLYSHMPEIYAIEDGVNGVLYQKDDPDSFVDRFRSVLDNVETRARMSASALKTAREKYNTAIMSERFIDVVDCVSA